MHANYAIQSAKNIGTKLLPHPLPSKSREGELLVWFKLVRSCQILVQSTEFDSLQIAESRLGTQTPTPGVLSRRVKQIGTRYDE